MKRIVHIAKDQEEAYQWDIKQAITMSHEERQEVAALLKKRVYGNKRDIKAWHKSRHE